MQIYTSYFAQLKKLPSNIVPVAICRFVPKWYNGAVYKKLAPLTQHLEQYKENKDPVWFQERYSNNVLRKLIVCNVMMDLQHIMFAQNPNAVGVCLVCFETSDKFCHRQIVAQWLQKYGYTCTEYNFNCT